MSQSTGQWKYPVPPKARPWVEREIRRNRSIRSRQSSEGEFILDEITMSGPMIGGCHIMSEEQAHVFCHHREEIEYWEEMYT